MTNSDDRKFIKPFPIPFLMNALQFLSDSDLSNTQKKAIAMLYLEYLRNCANEEMKLINGIISEIGNLESKD